MLLGLLLRRALCATSVCLLVSTTAAQSGGEGTLGPEQGTGPTLGKQGEGHFGVQLGYFNMSDSPGDGNPFLDESLTVIEPVFVYDYNVTDRLNLGATLSYDMVSSASIERLAERPNSQESGASGDNYIGGDFRFLYQANREWTWGGHLGVSSEYDYFSLGLGLNAAQELKNADATISYSLDVYQDSLDLIQYDSVNVGTDSRTSISGTVNWYQILSPKSHGTFGLTMAQQNGFLATPYNAVVVEGPGGTPPVPPLHNGALGQEYTEVLPESRTRIALYGRVLNSLGPGQAWEMGGRLYTDTWGINSVTVEPRYIFSMIEDKLDLRLRYRYYTQTEADDFGESFSAVDASNPTAAELPAERTQDSDLGAYDSHTLGTKWIWFLEDDDTFTFNLDYTMRSDGLNQVFASIGWLWSF